MNVSGYESGTRWVEDGNGIVSVALDNANVVYYVEVWTAGSYDLRVHYLPAEAADKNMDGFGDGMDNCEMDFNPA